MHSRTDISSALRSCLVNGSSRSRNEQCEPAWSSLLFMAEFPAGGFVEAAGGEEWYLPPAASRMGGQKLSRLLHGDVVVEGAVVVLLRLRILLSRLLRDVPRLLMLGWQQGDLGQAMRKDGNARGFDLQRLDFFA